MSANIRSVSNRLTFCIFSAEKRRSDCRFLVSIAWFADSEFEISDLRLSEISDYQGSILLRETRSIRNHQTAIRNSYDAGRVCPR